MAKPVRRDASGAQAMLASQIHCLGDLLEDELRRTKRGRLVFTVLGTLFAVSALVIPSLTWVMVRDQWLSQADYPNIYTLLISSTTFGAIAVGVGVALLRHAGKLGDLYVRYRDRALRYEQMYSALMASDLDSSTKDLVRLLTVLALIGAPGDSDSGSDGDDPAGNVSSAMMERVAVRLLDAMKLARGS